MENETNNLNTNNESVTPVTSTPVEPVVATQSFTYNTTVNTQSASTSSSDLPEEYKPISMLGYLGYNILFNIPCIGWILIIVFAFAPKNVNVKNFARSFLLLYVILFVVYILLLIFTPIIVAIIGNN